MPIHLFPLLLILSTCFSSIQEKSVFAPELPLTIQIIPVGKVETQTINLIRENIQRTFSAQIEVSPTLSTESIEFARSKSRFGYTGIKILSYFKSKNPQRKIILILDKPVYTRRELNGKIYPEWKILGLAYGNACLIAPIGNKARLDKVVVHELGHTMNLKHCENPQCLMTDAKGNAKNIDKARFNFCQKCSQKINRHLQI